MKSKLTEQLTHVLANEKLAALVAELDGSGEDGERELREFMDQHARTLTAERFILPVVGVQGCGKSTFLNAMLFSEPVLPIDADETTCVPVEVVYAENPSLTAEVRLKNGAIKRTPRSEEGLKPYIHNEQNPGNKKGVDRIVLQSSSDALTGGLVLVDLPGVESLTEQNYQTTLAYMREAIGFVYLLRTVPPLTKQESIFVAAQWRMASSVFFVQNRWTDESDEETRDGREHNERLLKSLAKKHHVALPDDFEVKVVNAHVALRDALRGDDAELAGSGMRDFQKTVEEFGVQWGERAVDETRMRLLARVDHAGRVSLDRIESLGKTREEGERQLAERRKRFTGYINKINAACDRGGDVIDDFESKMGRWVKKWRRDSAAQLRAEMNSIIDDGVVDGVNLTKAFNDHQEDVLLDLHERLQEEVSDLNAKLGAEFTGLETWDAERVGSARIYEREEKTKYENLFPPIAEAAGTIGGAIAGAEIGILGGPVGVIFGGFVGALAGAWMGKKTRKAVLESRGSEAKEQIDQVIDDFVDSTAQEAAQHLEQVATGLRKSVMGWLQEQKSSYEREHKQGLADIERSREERGEEIAALEQKVSTLSDMTRTLREGSHA